MSIFSNRFSLTSHFCIFLADSAYDYVLCVHQHLHSVQVANFPFKIPTFSHTSMLPNFPIVCPQSYSCNSNPQINFLHYVYQQFQIIICFVNSVSKIKHSTKTQICHSNTMKQGLKKAMPQITAINIHSKTAKQNILVDLEHKVDIESKVCTLHSWEHQQNQTEIIKSGRYSPIRLLGWNLQLHRVENASQSACLFDSFTFSLILLVFPTAAI